MNTLTYSQKIEDFLHRQSGCSLLDYCLKFKYYPLAIKIMELDENDEKKSKLIISRDRELKELYITNNNDKKAIARKGANRSWTQYFKDLISGWILEDLVIEMLRYQGIEVIHNGRDSQRIIDKGANVTQDADLLVRVGNLCRKVELSNELNPILSKSGFIEKRAPSLVKLWKDKGIWIYRDLTRGKYVLVDFGTEKVSLHLRCHNTVIKNWDKDVHRYILSENGKIERDDRLLAAELISVVGTNIDGQEQPILSEIEDIDSPPKIFTIGGLLRQKKPIVDSEEPTSNTINKTLDKVKIIDKPKELVQPSNKTSIELSVDNSSNKDEEDDSVENQYDVDYGDSDFV